jgi:hypothetical protein
VVKPMVDPGITQPSAKASAVKKRGGHQTIPLARGTPTIKLWSFDARSEAQSGDPLKNKGGLWLVNKEIANRAQWVTNTSRT